MMAENKRPKLKCFRLLLCFLVSGVILVTFILLEVMKPQPFDITYTTENFTKSNPDHLDVEILKSSTSRQQHEKKDSASDRAWQRVTMSDIEDFFRPRTLDICQNICQKADNKCLGKTPEEYNKLIAISRIKFIPLFSDHQYVYPYEKEYLSYPQITDENKLPDSTASKLVIIGAKNNVVHCNINEVVRGRVDLVDGYGDQRTAGGDEVRVWMNNGNLQAPGHVTDLRNGSYQISIKCLVPGELKLFVAVSYYREYLRAVIHQSHLGVARFVAGQFRNGDITESTICWATPNIPDRPCICNLTSVNGLSFYCGRPVNSRLNCTHWESNTSLNFSPPQNVTEVEKQLIEKAPSSARERLIRHNIQVFVNNSGKLPDLPHCSQTSPKTSWDWRSQPSGHWSQKKKWTSLVCRRPHITTQWATSCLKDTTVWIYGDSNGIRLYGQLAALLRASGKGGWPTKGIARQISGNITIYFTPSEFPLYTGGVLRKNSYYGSVSQNIDAIPSHGKHLVIVHYYLHVMPPHFSVLHSRLIAVHDAIKRLLLRNPDVFVGLRGPHVSSKEWSINHSVGGDNLGVQYLRLVEEIFQDLQDKVVFLDGWAMTIALENESFHPMNVIPLEMIRTLLSFKCN